MHNALDAVGLTVRKVNWVQVKVKLIVIFHRDSLSTLVHILRRRKDFGYEKGS
jgi:hypothetical protein